jgi:hypothetical protein
VRSRSNVVGGVQAALIPQCGIRIRQGRIEGVGIGIRAKSRSVPHATPIRV